MTECCNTCKFVKKYDHVSNLLCRRYPPIGAGRMRAVGPFYEGEFPRVDKDDWCGEFRLRADPGADAPKAMNEQSSKDAP